jgi:hypothetical protein
MHIKITNQETGKEAILCIERGAKRAEVIKLDEVALLHDLELITKAMGCSSLMMVTDHPFEGWTNTVLPVAVKEFK